jgi:hypothetical protein
VPAPPLHGEGLTTRQLRVQDSDVVVLRAIVEAYEGLAVFYGDGSGLIALSAPTARSRELDQLVDDLVAELPITRV